MVNTTSSISGGDVPTRPQGHDKHPVHHVINGTALYDEMDAPEITQSLEARGYYAVTKRLGVYEPLPVDSFLVFDDGFLYGVDKEGEDLAERSGFQGYVFIAGGADELSGEEIEQLLEETKEAVSNG
jgi:hypothetical protein